MKQKQNRAITSTVHIALVLMLCVGFSQGAHAVQRMGISAGTTTLQPNSSSTLSSRCLDEHDGPPLTGHSYTQVLSDDPQDITVKFGNEPAVPFDQAVKDGIVKVTGYSDGSGGYGDISMMRIHNLTDKKIVVTVRRFTPIGTASHNPIGYDISRLSGMGQQELWQTQQRLNEEARKKKEEEIKKEAEEKRRRREEQMQHVIAINAVIPGEEVVNPIGMTFRLIPVEPLSATSTDEVTNAQPNTTPVAEIVDTPFYLATTEVTQAQYERVMGENPSHYKDAQRPVEMVSWKDAQAFCLRLSLLDSEANYRLPTGMEWEYACRAEGGDYFWERDGVSGGAEWLDGFAWWGKNSGNETHFVATKAPNPWGLYDMAGNVAEWSVNRVLDQTENSIAPGGSQQSVHGGTFDSQVGTDFMCAHRDTQLPDHVTRSIGFRCVRVPIKTLPPDDNGSPIGQE